MPYSDGKEECVSLSRSTYRYCHTNNKHREAVFVLVCRVPAIYCHHVLINYSQLYTRSKWNDLNTKSQIDFIFERLQRVIQDARAVSIADLGTDHRPIILS